MIKTLRGRPSRTMTPRAVNLGESIQRGAEDNAEKIKKVTLRRNTLWLWIGMPAEYTPTTHTYNINSCGKLASTYVHFEICSVS